MKTFKGRNIEELVEKLLAGTVLKEEEHLLKEWLNLSSVNETFFREKVRHSVQGCKDQYEESFSAEQGWREFKKIQSSPVIPLKRISFWIGVAAVVLLAFFIGRLLPFHSSPVTDQEFHVYAPKGEKARVDLPDGSRVTLNGETALTWMGVEGGIRKVALKGEGFFEVKADIEHPFEVKVDTLLFTVTGTKFNIYGYQKEPVVSTLVEGRIKVGMPKAGKEMVLKPGQTCRVANREAPFELLEGDVRNYIGWRNDCLIFKNEPLFQVVRKIERWYGVKIFLQGEGIKDLRFTGTFQAKSLNRVLKTLCKVGDLNFQSYGTTIILKE